MSKNPVTKYPFSKIALNIVQNVNSGNRYHIISFDGTVYRLQRILSSSTKSCYPVVFITIVDFKNKYQKVT